MASAQPAVERIIENELTNFSEAALAVKLDFAQPLPALSIIDDGGPRPEFFAEGARFMSATAGLTFGNDNAELYPARFGFGYFLGDNFSATIEAGPTFANVDNDDDVVGVGLDLIFRFHFWRHEPWSVYLDGGPGLIYYDNDFPPGATEFNFTLQVGAGVTYQINDQAFLMSGIRWYHNSNARINGIDRNIGFDTLVVYLGVMLPF